MKLHVASILALLCFLVGCGSEKASLYEHEHALPKNWPGSLLESADRVDAMLASITSSQQTNDSMADFKEFIGYLPEAAAEQDLAEQEWDSINQLCAATESALEQPSAKSKELADILERLADSLRSAQMKLQSSQQ